MPGQNGFAPSVSDEDDYDIIQEIERARQELKAPPVAPTLISRRGAGSNGHSSPNLPPPRQGSAREFRPELYHQYEYFLEAIKTGNHPDHCELVWEPPNFFRRFTVKFQGEIEYPPTGDRPELEERQRAWEYFSGYTLTERMTFSFTVAIQKGAPTVARVSISADVQEIIRPGTKRLQDLSTPAWYKPGKPRK